MKIIRNLLFLLFILIMTYDVYGQETGSSYISEKFHP